MTQQLSITQYARQKELGNITAIASFEDGLYCSSKVFNPENGERLPDMQTPWSIADLLYQAEQAEKFASELRMAVADGLANPLTEKPTSFEGIA